LISSTRANNATGKDKAVKKKKYTHSVSLDASKCVGCTNCIKKCPTQAIRVRNGLAHISEGRCIDCGECIKNCPHHAKLAVTDAFELISRYKYKVALIAPSFYAQFGTPATRANILTSILNIGFDDVYEVAMGADVVTAATIAELSSDRNKVARPVISSACPAVVRLIQIKYPGLIDNLLDYDSPMEITAKHARKEISQKMDIPEESIGVFFISPCPAKKTAVEEPYGVKKSNVDGVIAISDIYPLVLAKLEKPNIEATRDIESKKIPSQDGIRWGSIGGESIALNSERFLAVDGIHNVISILEEIENERLKDVDFIEANSCIGGCIGGPLTVANMYSAKTRLARYVKEARNSISEKPDRLFDPDSIPVKRWKIPLSSNNTLKLDSDLSKALEKYDSMQKILKNLPGLDCGACGAPDCAALAEDIVRNKATETDCIFKLREKIQLVASQMIDLETEMTKFTKTDEEKKEPRPSKKATKK
jgi:iron only hydrogenase large subunit-like protein